MSGGEPGGLLVLTYHSFRGGNAATATTPERLSATLDALLGRGWRPLCLDNWVARGRPDEPRGFALTIDDGLASIHNAAGVLLDRGVPATLFVVTGRVGGDNAWPGQPPSVPRERLLGWPALRELAGLGFTLGAHGRSHARLGRLAPEALRDELCGSRDDLEQRTGAPCRLFAYPYGEVHRRAVRTASAHFAAAFTTRLDRARDAQSRHRLARVDACYLQDGRVLDALVSGRGETWMRRRRALRAAKAGAVATLRLAGLAR